VGGVLFEVKSRYLSGGQQPRSETKDCPRKTPAGRGAPLKYPKAIKLAVRLLGKHNMSDRKIHRLCQEKYKCEKIPASPASFMRRVRDYRKKQRG
jgi:hypothetical protein